MATARSTLYTVMLVSFLGTAGIALPYSILSPFFLADGTGCAMTRFLGWPPKILLGIVLSLYPLGMLIGGSFVGALSDVYGRKKVLLATMFIAALGYLLTGWAAALDSYPVFAFARLLTGICEGNLAVSRSIALDLHPRIDRTRAVSLVYSTVYAGWLIGPPVGAKLAVFGLESVFYVAALVTLAAMVPVALVIQRRPPDRPREGSILRAMAKENSLGLLRVAAIRPLLLYHLLYTLGLNAFYEFYPMWLVERWGFDEDGIAWVTVVVTVVMVVVSVVGVATLSRRIPGIRLVVFANFALGTTFILLPLTGPPSLYAVFALSGGVIAVANGVFPSYMSGRFGEYGQGRVMGLLTTSFCAANVVMALLGSFVALLGSSWSLITGGVLCVLASLWLGWLQPASGSSIRDTRESLASDTP